MAANQGQGGTSGQRAQRTGANRLLAINTPLGEDVLLIRSLNMTEELGRPFHAELELRSEKHDIAYDEIIGKNCTIRLMRTDGQTRFINGYISRFVQEGAPSEGRSNVYRATFVPWLWFLTRTSDCRIFQEKSYKDIIMEVFRDHGFSEFKDECSGEHPKHEYVVQYRETAFNFVSRLMEEEGIYYYFEHENGKHMLVLCDQADAHAPVDGYASIPYVEQTAGNVGMERLFEWVVEKQVQTQSFALRDFDFKVPGKNLDSNRDTDHPVKELVSEYYDYPGGYHEKADGDSRATLRAEEVTAHVEVCRARGDVRGLLLGSTFELTGFPREDQNRKYLVTSMAIHAETDDYSSGGGSENELFQCALTVIPADRNYRAARVTPKPVISGPQHALVTGPKGEEIFTDEFGRVKVWFPWDRHADKDDATSCWIRVAQVWAGKAWGGMFIPRIGQEVIIEFMEGDPDRPVVTGRVYNGTCTVPYKLPDNKTMSTIKSNSSKGGGGFNEFRFEDKKGSEQIFIHAERQLDVRVKSNRYETIGNDRHLVVENDKFEHIKNNRSETIDGDHMEKIGKDRHLTVVGKEAVQIDGSKSLGVGGNVIEKFGADQVTTVSGELHIKADTIILEASTNITIKVGGSSYLAIDSSSADIKSTNVTFKADANLKLEAAAQLDAKGAMVKIEGDAMADLKSPMTTVNGSGMLTLGGGLIKMG